VNKLQSLFLRIGIAVVVVAPFLIGAAYGFHTAGVVNCSSYSGTAQNLCKGLYGSEFDQRLSYGVLHGVLAYVLLVLAFMFWWLIEAGSNHLRRILGDV